MSVNGNSIGETEIEKSSNRLKLDKSADPIDISKFGEQVIIFAIKK